MNSKLSDDMWREWDRRHLWHPYTDHVVYSRNASVCVERAEGVYLYEAGGRPILDGIASWWAVALGHSHPRIVSAIQRQAAALQHSILGTLTHGPAIELAERLAALAPGDLNRVYFAADGSCVVEAALKMAVQYWRFRGRPGRTRFITLEEGYHGDTLGAISVGYTSWFQEPFGALVTPALRAPSPWAPGALSAGEQEAAALRAFEGMAELVERHAGETAAVIVEPLCQAAAGIRIYPAEYLRRLRALCDAHDVLLIADEIAVGLGRTGSMWAGDHAGIAPDILCIGKALTGGTLPMSAAIASDRIFEAFLGGDGEKRVFWDGHTFCGNPITAAAALAALDVFRDERVIEASQPRIQQLHAGFDALAALDCVEFTRSLGMIAMLSLKEDAGGAALAARAASRALELGLFLRPLGPVLYLWPPLTTSAAELDDMLGLLRQAILDSCG